MAGLLYKKDWDEAKDRFRKWWNRDETDRPVFSMQICSENIADSRKEYFSNVEDRWLDTDRVLDWEEGIMRNSIYPAEGYPAVTPSLGPGSLGVFLGAVPVFEPRTVWYKPCFDDIEKAEICFDKNSRFWKWTVDFSKKAAESGKGKYLVLIPDLIENIDTIASLVGTEQLLYYLMDCPEEIHRLQKQILPAWFDAHEEIYQMVKDEDGGSAWLGFNIWAPGRMAKLQCDFSAMISKDMFDEFVLPYLKEQSDRSEYSLYHLDGANALQHLDSLLSIESLDAIQWQPGAGAPDGGDPCWDEVYKRILDAGKSVDANIPIEKIESFVKRFGKKGIFIYTEPESEKQAYDLIDKSYNW